MQKNLKITRIQGKLDVSFQNKIDMSDVKLQTNTPPEFYSRSIAALSLIMKCGIDEDVAGKSVTDGYHDMGIDAIYNDSNQKN